MNRLTIKTPDKRDYDVVFSDSFDGLGEELARLELTGKKAYIVTDSHVEPLYASTIEKVLEDSGCSHKTYSFKAGEESKTSDTVNAILDELIQGKYTRDDILLALGGGVVGDVAGYAASMYRRGLNFIQVPTTLLAMVDSSVGGKNGVDYNGYKNMIGTFYFPKLVYSNLKTLDTLDERQFYNGFAEAMKSALIRDQHYYEWQIENMYEIQDKDYDTLEDLVLKAVTCKKIIVEKDPFESGERALLNLGHTIGHAIEKEKMGELMHGECVALGTVAAAHISYQKEMLSLDEYLEIRDMFVPFNLPITIDNIDLEKVCDNILLDKKNDATGLKVILLKKIGKAVIDRSVTKEEIVKALKEIEYTDDFE